MSGLAKLLRAIFRSMGHWRVNPSPAMLDPSNVWAWKRRSWREMKMPGLLPIAPTMVFNSGSSPSANNLDAGSWSGFWQDMEEDETLKQAHLPSSLCPSHDNVPQICCLHRTLPRALFFKKKCQVASRKSILGVTLPKTSAISEFSIRKRDCAFAQKPGCQRHRLSWTRGKGVIHAKTINQPSNMMKWWSMSSDWKF